MPGGGWGTAVLMTLLGAAPVAAAMPLLVGLKDGTADRSRIRPRVLALVAAAVVLWTFAEIADRFLALPKPHWYTYTAVEAAIVLPLMLYTDRLIRSARRQRHFAEQAAPLLLRFAELDEHARPFLSPNQALWTSRFSAEAQCAANRRAGTDALTYLLHAIDELRTATADTAGAPAAAEPERQQGNALLRALLADTQALFVAAGGASPRRERLPLGTLRVFEKMATDVEGLNA